MGRGANAEARIDSRVSMHRSLGIFPKKFTPSESTEPQGISPGSHDACSRTGRQSG
jgi:hypothetical protein